MTVEQSAIAGRVVVRRPDIPLRVAAFWCGYSATFIGLGFVLALAPPSGRMLFAGLLVTIASIALTRVLTRSEGASLATAGAAWSRGSVARFSSGMVFGGVMIALLVGLSRAAIGPVAFVRNPDASLLAVPMMIATYVALAAGEELGFRGYPLRTLVRRVAMKAGQALHAREIGSVANVAESRRLSPARQWSACARRPPSTG